MDRMEAWMWLGVVQQAKEGETDAQEMLRQENELRALRGKPTVEDELIRIAQESNK